MQISIAVERFGGGIFDEARKILRNHQGHCVVPMIGSAMVHGADAKKRVIGRCASTSRDPNEKSRCNPGSKP
jgi:hypothetical protein